MPLLDLLFWKYGVPILITILQKSGAINAAERLGLKAIDKLENLKTYSEPTDFPQAPPVPTDNNINKG